MTYDCNEDDSPTNQFVDDTYVDSFANSDRRPVLVALGGELLATPIPLERDQVVLGRALEADIRLNDAKSSRLHARICIEVDPKSGRQLFKIQDLSSTNGTLVNGQIVREAVLTPGDKILIGDHLFRFELLDEIDRAFQQQIRRLIGHDELTGLLTSKSFFTELRREASQAAEASQPFCVLMMDLDHFKVVNDTYGHLIGSRTLQDVGVIIKAALRSGDVGLDLEARSLRLSCWMRITLKRWWLESGFVEPSNSTGSRPRARESAKRDRVFTSRSALAWPLFPMTQAIRYDWLSWQTPRSIGLREAAGISCVLIAPRWPQRLKGCDHGERKPQADDL